MFKIITGRSSVLWSSIGLVLFLWTLGFNSWTAIRSKMWSEVPATAGMALLSIMLVWILKRGRLKYIFRDFLSCTGIYATIWLGGLLVVLAGCSLTGYLPYSDRPGPGWGDPHLPRLAELQFYAEWELFMVPIVLFSGALFFTFVGLLSWLRTSHRLVRLLGGVLCGLWTGLATAGAGWYIALAAFPADAALVLGLLVGIFVLPWFTFDGKTNLPLWVRASGIALVSLALAAYIFHPMIP